MKVGGTALACQLVLPLQASTTSSLGLSFPTCKRGLPRWSQRSFETQWFSKHDPWITCIRITCWKYRLLSPQPELLDQAPGEGRRRPSGAKEAVQAFLISPQFDKRDPTPSFSFSWQWNSHRVIAACLWSRLLLGFQFLCSSFALDSNLGATTSTLALPQLPSD